MCSRAGLDALENRAVLMRLPDFQPRTVQPSAYSLFRLRYSGYHFVVVTAGKSSETKITRAWFTVNRHSEIHRTVLITARMSFAVQS